MPTLTLNRAAYYQYTDGFVDNGDPIKYGQTEDTDLEQTVFEFDINPSEIDTGSTVTFTFTVDAAATTSNMAIRRWKNAYPVGYATATDPTALNSSTNQIIFANGTGVRSFDVKNLIADMVTAGQTKVLLGIPIGSMGVTGEIDNTAGNKPTLAYSVVSGPEGTATLDVDAITMVVTGRADTRKGTSTRTLDAIILDSIGDSDVANDALLVVEPITMVSAAISFIRGISQNVIDVSTVVEGKVYVKGTGIPDNILVSLISNNHRAEGTAILILDDILVSGEIPQGGEPRRGDLSELITVSLVSQGAFANFGETNSLTPDPILITLYARIAGPPPVEADSPFLDSKFPLFVGPKNATFSSMS
jgi:hypothetical protein